MTADLMVVNNDRFIAPVVQVQDALVAYQAFKDLVAGLLREDQDYGKVPGTDKPTLLKPGAEKLCNVFGLRPTFETIESVSDWTGVDHNGEPFFLHHVCCKLLRNGEIVSSAEGLCSSWESKYRWRWVPEAQLPPHLAREGLRTRGGKVSEFAFAIEKAETSGQYGKPAAYWQQFRDAIANGTARKIQKSTKKGAAMDAWEIDGLQFRVPNEDIYDVANTVLKMASKRAFVAATLLATHASDYFTQDVEDYVDADFVEAPNVVVVAPGNAPGKAVGAAAPATAAAGQPPEPEEPPAAAPAKAARRSADQILNELYTDPPQAKLPTAGKNRGAQIGKVNNHPVHVNDPAPAAFLQQYAGLVTKARALGIQVAELAKGVTAGEVMAEAGLLKDEIAKLVEAKANLINNPANPGVTLEVPEVLDGQTD